MSPKGMVAIPDLGRRLYSWTYRPSASRKRRAIATLLLTVALAGFAFYLARYHWKAKGITPVFESILYVLVGLQAKSVEEAFRKRHYEIFELGVVVRRGEEEPGKEERARVLLWERFRDCRLLAEGVRLVPRRALELSVTLLASGQERWSVYNLCRERILRARAEAGLRGERDRHKGPDRPPQQ
ncbi:MAG: hypothetical protein ONB23_10570 [candidate division KSB1 bacterium]|nr:hypothetical protein [candidate division KSB1 bacterium]